MKVRAILKSLLFAYALTGVALLLLALVLFAFVIDHNIELYQEFILRASNAGIIHAHGQAADYYLNTDKNCDEAEKRMRLLMEDKDNLSAGDVNSIMSAISMYMIRGNVLSDGLEDVVVTLINWGYPIEKDSTGVYVMLSKREKSL